jgi:hypothetical protein
VLARTLTDARANSAYLKVEDFQRAALGIVFLSLSPTSKHTGLRVEDTVVFRRDTLLDTVEVNDLYFQSQFLPYLT